MADRNRPLYYQPTPPQDAVAAGQVILRDGTTAELRPARPGDEELFQDFVQRISAASREQRFMGSILPDTAARRLFSDVDPEARLTLVVVKGSSEGSYIIATGEYIRGAPAGDEAEFALLVDDSYHGKGLGTLLLERLAGMAAQHGIRHFTGYTEADNQKLLELLSESGFAIEKRRLDRTLIVSFSIAPSLESVTRTEERDRIATVTSLLPLLRPSSVALIGASRTPGTIGHRILESLVRNRFNGPVYPVNPSAAVVGSIPAYPSVLAIPGPVDLAVIAVPRDAVFPAVVQCGEKGVRALVVISAGFAETGPEGRELQDRLMQTVHGYGMRMVGPNCMGVINTASDVRMAASFVSVFPPSGRIAMSSQSGALGLAVLEYAQDMGLGLSTFVSVGNKADVSGNDLIQYWEDDPDTDLILLYLESFGNPRRFGRLARRVARHKPILAVKAGRTAAGRRAAGSHTAALAASDTGTAALFKQAGVIRANTLEEMFDIAALLANQPLPQGPRVAVVTNAGGPGILATDALADAGLEVPEPTRATQELLRTFLATEASVANPIDMIAGAGPAEYRQAVAAVLADATFDAVMVVFIPVDPADVAGVAAAVRSAVASARAEGNRKPVLACFMSSAGLRSPLALGVPAPGGESGNGAAPERIPSYRFPESAAYALARAYEYAQWRAQPLGEIPDHPDLDIAAAQAVCQLARERGGGWLSAPEVAAVLQAFGLPVAGAAPSGLRGAAPTGAPALPDGGFAANVADAVALAEDLGYPVVVKMASRTLIHKTEWDGVRLGLNDRDAVREACTAIADRLRGAGKLGELDGFVVQPMLPGGVEVMVGVTHDPRFGPLIAFGLGGIHVEVLSDVTFRMTPITDRDATEMVAEIRGYRLLTGLRGQPPADLAAIHDVLLRVSRLVEEIPALAEIEFNPLKAFAPGEGCRILDARIRVDG